MDVTMTLPREQVAELLALLGGYRSDLNASGPGWESEDEEQERFNTARRVETMIATVERASGVTP